MAARYLLRDRAADNMTAASALEQQPPRPLDQITVEMQALAAEDKDPEDGHVRADDLLVEALNTLAIAADARGPVTELVMAYARVRKWYA